MGEKKKQAMIGVFVLGALTLLIAGVVLFGSGRFFTNYIKAIMYFDGSVKGLNIGSPVMFQGVKIGTVSEIRLIADLEKLSLQIPVVVAIESDKFSTVGSYRSDKDFIGVLIAKGMRAQLQTQSMVTGQLIVNLAFSPETEVRLVGRQERGIDKFFAYPEIPTIPSASQSMQLLLEGLPVKELLDKAQSILVGVDRLVNSPESQGVVTELNKTLVEIRGLSQNLNRDVPALAQGARQTLTAATGVIDRTDKWLVDNRDVAKGMAKDLATTLAQMRKTFETTQQTLEVVKAKVSDERITYQLQNTLREVGEAARSLRQLSDYLERHPEAVLIGRPEGG